MNTEATHDSAALGALASVARAARALVGVGPLSKLSGDAMAEIREALELDLAALYLADSSGSHVLDCVGWWPTTGTTVAARSTVALEPEAWRFLAASSGPLVFREREGWVMDNPFEPAADHWVVIPLVSQLRVLGAVTGTSEDAISLAPAAVTRLALIGDLLSVGAANELLRAEIQRNELERERIQLAEEIHDSLAQDLAAAVRELALLETRPSAESARSSQDRLREAVLDAHRVVRRHLEVLGGDVVVPGLAAAMTEVSARFRRRGLTVTIARVPDDDDIEPAAVAVVLRVVCEALANVLRHAGVTQATVSIDTEPNSVRVRVTDAGQGFDIGTIDTGSGHFGLAIMRSRARAATGTLTIHSQPGEGTAVELILPRKPSSV